jgi:hypothetical protein
VDVTDQQLVSPCEGVLADLISPNQELAVAWAFWLRTLERMLNRP